MVGVERNQTQIVAIPVGDSADPLAQAERVGLGAVGRLDVADGFPLKAGMAVDAVPVLNRAGGGAR